MRVSILAAIIAILLPMQFLGPEIGEYNEPHVVFEPLNLKFFDVQIIFFTKFRKIPLINEILIKSLIK